MKELSLFTEEKAGRVLDCSASDSYLDVNRAVKTVACPLVPGWQSHHALARHALLETPCWYYVVLCLHHIVLSYCPTIYLESLRKTTVMSAGIRTGLLPNRSIIARSWSKLVTTVIKKMWNLTIFFKIIGLFSKPAFFLPQTRTDITACITCRQ
jgi:hypothetical protein